jgi:hypothetical protein
MDNVPGWIELQALLSVIHWHYCHQASSIVLSWREPTSCCESNPLLHPLEVPICPTLDACCAGTPSESSAEASFGLRTYKS